MSKRYKFPVIKHLRHQDDKYSMAGWEEKEMLIMAQMSRGKSRGGTDEHTYKTAHVSFCVCVYDS